MDYNNLENKPKIGGIEVVGDKKPYELGLQKVLTPEQLNAVNSGITSIDKQHYDAMMIQKQNTLSDTQLQVLNTNINNEMVADWNKKQKALTAITGYDPTKNLVLVCRYGVIQWEVYNG